MYPSAVVDISLPLAFNSLKALAEDIHVLDIILNCTQAKDNATNPKALETIFAKRFV